MLNSEEYIEQAYLFQALLERLPENIPIQSVLEQVREETLSTTRLPLAVDYLLAELRHSGTMAPAMRQLNHYFAPFQTYLIDESENDRGRFDVRLAVEILRHEAEYRARDFSRQGLFLYQFESLCRNRLQYDPGLLAISKDPAYDNDWKEWILVIRRQVGIIDFADMIYVRSGHFINRQQEGGGGATDPTKPVLFGVREGKIALANRQKDPLFLFAALQRQLDYPKVPRPKPVDDSPRQIAQMTRRLEQLAQRLKLVEEEQRSGIDLSRFYGDGIDIPPLD
jgi:hypothetical protein